MCQEIRRRGATPIIVLSGEGQEAAKVEALDAGADDYVTKLFGKEEPLGRIRAVSAARRTSSAECQQRSLRIDRRRHEAWAGDKPPPLTPIQFALLEALPRPPATSSPTKSCSRPDGAASPIPTRVDQAGPGETALQAARRRWSVPMPVRSSASAD